MIQQKGGARQVTLRCASPPWSCVFPFANTRVPVCLDTPPTEPVCRGGLAFFSNYISVLSVVATRQDLLATAFSHPFRQRRAQCSLLPDTLAMAFCPEPSAPAATEARAAFWDKYSYKPKRREGMAVCLYRGQTHRHLCVKC